MILPEAGGVKVPVPPFDVRGLLPPFVGADATTQERSPYPATMTEVTARLGTTPQRRQLLRNLIAYRELLASEGYQNGVQFIDGSFVENIEGSANRSPDDIDVFSILSAPQKYLSNQSAWSNTGLNFWQTEIADRNKNKQRFLLDTYAVLYEELQLQPMDLIQHIIYWYGLFSHQRDTFAWKGFVVLPLDPTDDQVALTQLGSA